MAIRLFSSKAYKYMHTDKSCCNTFCNLVFTIHSLFVGFLLIFIRWIFMGFFYRILVHIKFVVFIFIFSAVFIQWRIYKLHVTWLNLFLHSVYVLNMYVNLYMYRLYTWMLCSLLYIYINTCIWGCVKKMNTFPLKISKFI